VAAAAAASGAACNSIPVPIYLSKPINELREPGLRTLDYKVRSGNSGPKHSPLQGLVCSLERSMAGQAAGQKQER
jgi:hypothetical protein